MSNNRITSFAPLETKFIERLNLSNNQLSSIPSLNRYRILFELKLSGNQLKKFPEDLPLNYELRYLDLSFNQIQNLPEDLNQLKRLSVLDLTGNPIPGTEIDRIKRLLPTTDVRF